MALQQEAQDATETIDVGALVAALSYACARPTLRTVPVESIDTLDYVLGAKWLNLSIQARSMRSLSHRAQRPLKVNGP